MTTNNASADQRLAKLSFAEKVGYGLGDAGFNFYWAIIGSYLVFFYTDIFGIAPAAAAVMVTTTKIIDAFTDPAMGAIADRTNTRWGKFRPYLCWGALPMMGAAVLTMSTPNLGDDGKLIWAYCTYSLMMLSYTVLSTPYSSLSGVMTANTQERSNINSVRFFFAYFSSIIVGAATPDIAEFFGGGDRNSAKGWQMTMVVYSAIATVCFIITFLSTKERIKPAPTQKTNPIDDIKDLLQNKPWLILFVLAMVIMVTFTLRGGSAAYYFKYFVERPDLLGAYIGLQTAGLMIGAMSASTLTRFIDKRKLLMILMGIVGLLCIAFSFVPKPKSLGVVEVSTNHSVTLNAATLLGTELPENTQYAWTSHEKVFWIIKKKVPVSDAAPTLSIDKAKGKVFTVKATYQNENNQIVVIDSAELPNEIILMFVLSILISLALGPKAPITWSMYADAADYNEWRTGRRATGMTFSATTFSQKLGSAMGSAIMLTVLATLGYKANEAQSGASIDGIVYMQTIAPGVFALLSIIALKFYGLTHDKLEQIQSELKQRQVSYSPET